MTNEEEVPEFYSDVFEVVGGPYGVVMNFREGPSEPRQETPQTVARIRMSWEHAKTMIYVMWRFIKKTEQDTGVSYPIPTKVLSDLKIGYEDWQDFWKSSPTL